MFITGFPPERLTATQVGLNLLQPTKRDQGKVREVLRAVEDNLLREALSSFHALVSHEFFDG